MRILIIDDDADILDSTSMLLELEGLEVAAVRRAPEILDAAAAFQPELILHDVNMPRLDLAASLTGLRELLPDCRLFLFSAAAEAPDVPAAARIQGWLRKPFAVEDLMAHIDD